jgi:hypothetical protein
VLHEDTLRAEALAAALAARTALREQTGNWKEVRRLGRRARPSGPNTPRLPARLACSADRRLASARRSERCSASCRRPLCPWRSGASSGAASRLPADQPPSRSTPLRLAPSLCRVSTTSGLRVLKLPFKGWQLSGRFRPDPSLWCAPPEALGARAAALTPRALGAEEIEVWRQGQGGHEGLAAGAGVGKRGPRRLPSEHPSPSRARCRGSTSPTPGRTSASGPRPSATARASGCCAAC